MHSILIVDDEKNMLTSLKSILEDEGYRIAIATSGEDGLKLFEAQPFDMMITDLKMSGLSGLDLLEKVRHTKPEMPVILITAFATPKSAVEAIKAGAFDYIPKPFDPEEILFSIKKAIEFTSIQQENISLRETLQVHRALEEIIGDDSSMMSVRQLIQSVAPTKATVLIQGESGTGKELVAKAIHELSDSRGNRFVPVNCAAIPENLLESELFGHEKGAFTGAVCTKKGKFELADEGTIYLDEIGDMSLSLQAKILRVLEDGRFERVGGTSSIKSEGRIIAATNKDLKKAIQEGVFREDLFFRLNVINIDLPALRERVSDIPKLVQHFIRRFNISHGKNIAGTTPEVLKVMTTYAWPGNVRELRNTIERGVLLEKGTIIQLAALPPEIVNARLSPNNVSEFNGKIDFKTTVETYEKQLIEWALKKHHHQVSRAAEVLGLSRHALRHYVLKYFKGERGFNAD